MALPKPNFAPKEKPEPQPRAFARASRSTQVRAHSVTSAVQPRSRLAPSPGTGKYVLRRDWRLQSEVTIRFCDAPATVTTRAIYDAFFREGELVYIDLWTSESGQRNGSGVIRFNPPPRNDFWKNGFYSIVCPPEHRPYRLQLRLMPWEPREYQAPLNGKLYPEHMSICASSLHFGYMHSEDCMKALHSATPIQNTQIVLQQNVKYRQLDLIFPALVPSGNVRYCKLRFSHTSKMQVFQHTLGTDNVVLVFSLEAPPEFALKASGAGSHHEKAKTWNYNDQWFRYGNIVDDAVKVATSLNVPHAIVNIGRWTTYSLVFQLSESTRKSFTQFCDSLRDFNVPVQESTGFNFKDGGNENVWKFIDHVNEPTQATSNDLSALMNDSVIALPFEVRYQLEVCISEGRLNEYSLTKAFAERLASMAPEKAQELLEDVSASEKRFYEPMDIFEFKQFHKRKAKKLKLPDFCTVMRTVVVTPTTVYFTTPTVEISNRVIRQYKHISNRFLRIRFTDEGIKGSKIFSTPKNNMKYIFQRFKDTLEKGVTIGDMHYEFLAFGNSQLREHGAYLFSPTLSDSTESIRTWMGDFSKIQQVAKYAARLGQCFSTTRAVNTVRVSLNEVPDVMDSNKTFMFTDGVGIISHACAMMASAEMKIKTVDGQPPSVLQFRLGGAKGVLAVWGPVKSGMQVNIRPSQHKFKAEYQGLEVIRWSQFCAAHLNQQIISVLSALGVPDTVFLWKLRHQLASLADAMRDEKIAMRLLQTGVDHNQMTLVLAAMVHDGFLRAQDPFMVSILRLWRAWNIKYLKEKAKIAIPKGAVLLGCTDEQRVLNGHYNRLQPKTTNPTEQERLESTPEIFVQLSSGDGNKPQVMEGYMLLARNPSLHPGDIRVVRGVDRPELRHLKDVVVLPQTGDRDIASMCSGGDLDGDDYLVIWDEEFLPRIWNYPPMDYTVPAPIIKSSGVTIEDVTSFFVEYMKNDTLGDIAMAHRAQADINDDGVMNPKCLELAALHSQAVDFPKSGISASMEDHLRPRKWPHFMGRKPEKSYKSTKVLGKLYDEVELVNFEPEYDLPFDSRVLSRYQPSEEMLDAAKAIKVCYDDAVRRIIQQHDIATEFEVWTTFVMSHSKIGSDFRFHETIGQLTTSLKEQFREECIRMAGGREISKLGPFVAAMYRVTYDQLLEANKAWELKKSQGNALTTAVRKDHMPMISFPWIFHSVLGRLAIGELDEAEVTEWKPSWVPTEAVKQPEAAKLEEIEVDVVLQTEGGLTHRGDILEMFTGDVPQQITKTENLIDFGDDDDAAAPAEVLPSPKLQDITEFETTTAPDILVPEAPLPAHLKNNKRVEAWLDEVDDSDEGEQRTLPTRKNVSILQRLGNMQV